MVRRTDTFGPAVVVLCLSVTAGLPALGPAFSPQQSAAQNTRARAAVDVVVVDRDARSPEVLGAQEFRVTVDGQPRRVLGVRHVSRGPGAAAAAAAHQPGAGGTVLAAEPSRTVLVVLDETMLQRGDEKTVIQAANTFLDRLGLEDRVAIVRLPVSSTVPVIFTVDRPATRQALREVVGQAVAAAGEADANKPKAVDAGRVAAANPDRADAGNPDKVARAVEQFASVDSAAPLSQQDLERTRICMASLLNLFKGLQGLPGRKVVAVFSAGLPATSQALAAPLDSLASAAAAARASVYAFGLRWAQSDDRAPADLSPIETLAKNTGGVMAVLERDPARTIDKVVPDLAACYVLTIETSPQDGTGLRRLRVETSRKGSTVRAQAFLALRDDPDDRTISAPPSPVTPAAPPEGRPAGTPPSANRPAESKDADVVLALARLSEYVTGYQREFSAVVAEEEYVQTMQGEVSTVHQTGITGVSGYMKVPREVRTRSDFLLIRPEKSDAWVCFRDVFEVDRKPVRDRDDRLKRLFLDNPAKDALVQVQRIKEESARYNAERVERNINVPLFALQIVGPEYRSRFRFTLDGKADVAGVATSRIEFEERAHPTLVTNPRTGRDVPLRGWFLIEPGTGAIVQTGIDTNDVEGTARFVVSYRRDALLGLWVPERMEESYRVLPSYEEVIHGVATYSNFRRFQVKTEEKITIPK